MPIVKLLTKVKMKKLSKKVKISQNSNVPSNHEAISVSFTSKLEYSHHNLYVSLIIH